MSQLPTALAPVGLT